MRLIRFILLMPALLKFHKALSEVSYLGGWTRHDYRHAASQPDLLKRFEFDATPTLKCPRPDTWDRVMDEYEKGKDAYRAAFERGDEDEALRIWLVVKGGRTPEEAAHEVEEAKAAS